MPTDTTTLHISLPPNSAVWLAGLAGAAGVSRSRVISDAIVLLSVLVACHGDAGTVGTMMTRYYRRFAPEKDGEGNG